MDVLRYHSADYIDRRRFRQYGNIHCIIWASVSRNRISVSQRTRAGSYWRYVIMDNNQFVPIKDLKMKI